MLPPSILLRTAVLSIALALASGATATTPDIPYQQFTLANGLTVIVHEDHKAPLVAVNAWYHVGAKDEQVGKTGFAHLFEHLMFYSEHHREDHFKTLEKVGASNLNGTTDWDRTNYFENVPTTALDVALWIQSDRMGHTLGAIDEKLLAQERGIVQNEKRQGENQPYGLVFENLLRSTFPEGHPYRRTVIGSLADLDAASIADVQTWFKAYYGPSNAVLVLAGDIDLATAKAKTEKYFGHIPPGPPLPRLARWIAPRQESTRSILQDRVPQTRVIRAWNVPPRFGVEEVRLDLLAGVLGGSKSSRLYQRLVLRDGLADSVTVSNNTWEIAGLFNISVDVKRGVDAAKVEAAINEELARLLRDGPSEKETTRTRTRLQANFVRGIEYIGGFGGKSDVLAECQTYTGDAGCFREYQQRLAAAHADDVAAAGRRWLAQGDHTLTVVPFSEKSATAADVDRSKLPEVASYPGIEFPAIERATLPNGMKIVFARRAAVPVVEFGMLFDAGVAADQGRRPGTAAFTLGMLDEAAGQRDATAVAERAEELGARLGTAASLDFSALTLSALVDNLDPSLDLFADLVMRPRFSAEDLERVRGLSLAGLRQEKSRPGALATRVLPIALFPAGHAYAQAHSGSGNEEHIAALTREDLLAFQRDWLRPDNATLLIVGDAQLADLLPRIEKRFGDWRAASSPRPVKNLAKVDLPKAARVWLIDQPGASQANVALAQVLPSAMTPEAFTFDAANQVFGGDYTARINSNLRVEKAWSYGAYAGSSDSVGQRLWAIRAPVQIDKTVDTIKEIQRELVEFLGKRPVIASELDKVKAINTRSLPGTYESANSILRELGQMVALNRPDDYVTTLKQRTEALGVAEVNAAAKTLQPAAMTWLIVGDLAKIEQPIRDLKLGEVQVVDADGRVLR